MVVMSLTSQYCLQTVYKDLTRVEQSCPRYQRQDDQPHEDSNLVQTPLLYDRPE